MTADASSHLHIVHSTPDEEIIRISAPLTPDEARQDFDLGYPSQFEAVFAGSRQWAAEEHDAGEWTSTGWCLGACAKTTSLLHALTYFPWLAGSGGVTFPPRPAASASPEKTR